MVHYTVLFLVPPLVVTIDPDTVIAKVFESVTFVCYATGLGDLSFVWEHDGSVITASNSTLQQNSLTIDSVLPQHQGQYKCTVTSSYSTLSSYELTTLKLTGNFMHVCDIVIVILICCIPVPSFDAQTVLQQVSFNASTNTITVFIPRIDDSDGPIRYSLHTM